MVAQVLTRKIHQLIKSNSNLINNYQSNNKLINKNKKLVLLILEINNKQAYLVVVEVSNKVRCFRIIINNNNKLHHYSVILTNKQLAAAIIIINKQHLYLVVVILNKNHCLVIIKRMEGWSHSHKTLKIKKFLSINKKELRFLVITLMSKRKMITMKKKMKKKWESWWNWKKCRIERKLAQEFVWRIFQSVWQGWFE
mgnify:CR=1 FL=1